MIGVKTREGESFDRMYRRFKKSCEKSGLIFDINKNQYFEKPSDKKRRKKNNSKRKILGIVKLERL